MISIYLGKASISSAIGNNAMEKCISYGHKMP